MKPIDRRSFLSGTVRSGIVAVAATQAQTGEAAGKSPQQQKSHSGPLRKPLLLAEKGATDYRIVISGNASPSERHAAEELRDFFEQISGARLPIMTDEQTLAGSEIILGDNGHLRAIRVAVDFDSLGDEGFVIVTTPPHLVIAGGRRRGTLYGVYTFLEDYLGCRWFTPTVSRIPRMSRVEVGPIDIRKTPALEYREVCFLDAFDGDWAARNKLNSSGAALTEKHGGKTSYFPFVHSFFTLIPPDKYFDTHPEWFSLVDGRRTLTGRYKRTQLCLTNEAMIQQAITQVKEWIREHPEANIISISQNDGPGGWCECENCAALEEREGGAHSAPIIYFVNRIAEAVAVDHPHLAIDTLAYSYSRQAPKTLKPLPNVIVRLTTGSCGSHAIGDVNCSMNAPLRNDLRDWFRLTRRIYVWDYIVNFYQYLLPFPNLHTLGPNIRFFIDHGVRGIFEQGSGDVPHSDCAPLKMYLLAKILWNPECDKDKVVAEFLEAYYGPASEPIGRYLELLEHEVKAGDYTWFHMSPFERSSHPNYLRPEVLKEAAALFDKAERLVEDDIEYTQRVKRARLSIDYVRLQLGSRLTASARKAEERQTLSEWFRNAIEEFFSTAEQVGVGHMREASRPQSTMAEFRQLLEGCFPEQADAASEVARSTGKIDYP